jgi:hypothetical protein
VRRPNPNVPRFAPRWTPTLGQQAGSSLRRPSPCRGKPVALALHADTTDEIPSELWHIIELMYFGGSSQARIAEELGLPLDEVRSRTVIAMRLLRIALGGSG